MMLDLVRKLEGRSDEARRSLLLEELESRKWKVELQEYVYAGQPGCNLIVSLHEGYEDTILLVAHYDTFLGSPGANDDASALSILMDAAEKLQSENTGRNLRLIFFDDEEPTLYWKHPVGSSMYVKEYGVQDLYAVIDLELCGMGDAVGIWPVEGVEERPILKQITSVLEDCNVPFEFGKRIPGFYADYLPFRQSGFADAYCLTAFHFDELKKLRKFAESSSTGILFQYIAWRLLRIPTVPRIFQHYHTNADRSEFLSEDTLSMMSRIVTHITKFLART